MMSDPAPYALNGHYPRPGLVRDSFLCLDGPWTMNGRPIHVPYPPQAPLSGWEGTVPENLMYETRFDLPEEWLTGGRRILLHFGAVDQEAEVILNGKTVGSHRGGYLPFTLDVTGAAAEKANHLTVKARDTLTHIYPYGKQTKKPHGMWYTPVSGIWQSVWLEAVPEEYIEGLITETDLTGLTLTVMARGSGVCHVRIGEAAFRGRANTPFRIELPSPRLWTPEDPYLYPMDITFGGDRVKSYFGLRTVDIVSLPDGTGRLALNGKPLFLFGLLDQGYHPRGLFLPESPEEYDRDILRAKELGVNLLRKHVKVEPELFYYACDRLGILVMQDMVNSGPYNYIPDTVLPTIGFKYRPDCLPGSRKRRAFFEQHCLDTQDLLRHHPCLVGYTIFNEGWGQYNTTRIYRMLKAHDPSRFYLSASGWFKGFESDITGEHIYFKEKVVSAKNRPVMISECGGFTLDLRKDAGGHETYGYGQTDTKEALTDRIRQLMDNMVLPSVKKGLNGVVYTQLTDVEGEINGLYTYDRNECKVIPDRVRAMAEECTRAFKEKLKE